MYEVSLNLEERVGVRASMTELITSRYWVVPDVSVMGPVVVMVSRVPDTEHVLVMVVVK